MMEVAYYSHLYPHFIHTYIHFIQVSFIVDAAYDVIDKGKEGEAARDN